MSGPRVLFPLQFAGQLPAGLVKADGDGVFTAVEDGRHVPDGQFIPGSHHQQITIVS